MVLLYYSTCALVCEQCVVVARCLSCTYSLMASKNLRTICEPLSASTQFDMRNHMIRLSKDKFATCMALFLLVSNAHASLEYLLVIKIAK